MEVCHYLWTWHLSAYHFSQLGIQLISMTIHFHESCHSFDSFKRMHCSQSHCVFVWSSHAAKSFVVPPNVQREVEEVYLCSQNSLCVSTFELVLWLPHSHYYRTLFWVSYCRCGTHHGPPSTRLFPLTSAYHPGNSLRNKNLVPWDLYALITYSLTLDIGSHHWPLIDRIDWVFDIRAYIRNQ